LSADKQRHPGDTLPCLWHIVSMCRSIKVLRKTDLIVTPEDVSAAALQFVRKVSGFHKPSKANQAVFDEAVAEIAGATTKLLDRLGSVASHRNAFNGSTREARRAGQSV
jgi:hypothetical protein